MNYFNLLSTYPDPNIASAWNSQISAAKKTPVFAAARAKHGDEIFQCFAAAYAELRALPRTARRRL